MRRATPLHPVSAVFDLGRVLLVLSEERVEFIIVGGVAAALQGAPVLTQDVDILYRIENENLDRLERALSRLRAVARGDSRNLPFNRSHLLTTGHKLATTDAGALDVLGSINETLVYDDLIGSSDELEEPTTRCPAPGRRSKSTSKPANTDSVPTRPSSRNP